MANILFCVYESFGLLTNFEIRQVPRKYVVSCMYKMNVFDLLVRQQRHLMRNLRKSKIVLHSIRQQSAYLLYVIRSDAKIVHNKIWWQFANVKASERACDYTRKHLSMLTRPERFYALCVAAIPISYLTLDIWFLAAFALFKCINYCQKYLFIWITRHTTWCSYSNEMIFSEVPSITVFTKPTRVHCTMHRLQSKHYISHVQLYLSISICLTMLQSNFSAFDAAAAATVAVDIVQLMVLLV